MSEEYYFSIAEINRLQSEIEYLKSIIEKQKEEIEKLKAAIIFIDTANVLL
jgi:predicted RNase H-like nuclease (RuvC/YqgF family)